MAHGSGLNRVAQRVADFISHRRFIEYLRITVVTVEYGASSIVAVYVDAPGDFTVVFGHEFTEIHLRRPHDKVKVIRHVHEGKDIDIADGRGSAQAPFQNAVGFLTGFEKIARLMGAVGNEIDAI
jgi:hypothetical protein